MHADEIVCQVLREEGKTPQSSSYMWIYRIGSDGLPSIISQKRKTLKLLDIYSLEAIKELVILETDLEKYIPVEIGVAYCNKLLYL